MKDLIRGRRLSYDLDEEAQLARARRRPPATQTAGQRISPTVSAAAIAEAQNALEAAHAAGDYRHQSVGDLIREALGAYGNGLRLSQQARSGRKKRHTVELSPELLERYRELPSRSRGVILERALLSLLARGLGR